MWNGTKARAFHVTEQLTRMSSCGLHIVWRNRPDFVAKRAETENTTGPILLATTYGPNADELTYFRENHKGQHIVLLHHSDELGACNDDRAYEGVAQVFRHYYHAGMGDGALQYLLQNPAGPVPKVLWMPLGLSNLKSLPPGFKYAFADRAYLWGRAGGTSAGRPERTIA